MKMAQSLNRVLYATVFITVNLIHTSFSLPRPSRQSPDTVQINKVESTLLSALHHRTKREVGPLPTTVPKVAAHYSVLIPRSYAHVRKPAFIYPIYYYHPRFYVRVPRYNNYLTPKSELFTTGGVGNYINNILPIFNQETPKVKVDPAPAELPAIPSAPIDGKGVPGINAMNPSDPLGATFPFFNQQASSWVWPDRIVTGKLPKADVNIPASTLFELNKKIQKHRDLQHPNPSEPVVVGVAEAAFPPFALNGNDPQLVDKPAVISTSSTA